MRQRLEVGFAGAGGCERGAGCVAGEGWQWLEWGASKR